MPLTQGNEILPKAEKHNEMQNEDKKRLFNRIIFFRMLVYGKTAKLFQTTLSKNIPECFF